MSIRIRNVVVSMVLLFVSFSAAEQYVQNNLFGLKVSTLGIGVEAGRSVGKAFNVRVGANWFSYPAEFDNSDFNIEGSLDLISGSLMADYFPLKGSFRLTGGTFLNFNNASVTLTPKEEQILGGVTRYVSGIMSVSV